MFSIRPNMQKKAFAFDKEEDIIEINQIIQRLGTNVNYIRKERCFK
jgi:hypothetical protein